jgi:hypothetical protein
MLEPDQRRLLIDALTPPPEMTLDYAVGTTFSLDLEALLIAPVAFALFDTRVGEHGDITATDPLSLMEAVRRHADRMDIFCQTGQIAIPHRYQPILASLETSIHPAKAPRSHRIFHPKVWALRFTAPDTRPAYRLLCLSRNLTFDRSWDVLVRLDGIPTSRSPELASRNGPLTAFIAALPSLTVLDMGARADRVRALAADLRTVDFELPAGFNDLRFHPTGIPEFPRLNPPDGDRRLVIAPFLAPRALQQLSLDGSILISRPASLDHIDGDTLGRYKSVHHLADGSFDSEEASDEGTDPTEEALAEHPTAQLSGLHAKVLVTDQGPQASVMVGSANATEAGLDGNVEMMVELIGRRSVCGVKATLGDGDGSFASLLTQYQRSTEEPAPTSDSDRVAYQLDAYGRELAKIAFTATVESDDELYRLHITADRPLPSGETAIRIWPITLNPETQSANLDPAQAPQATFTGLSLTSVTSFLALELSADSQDGPVSVRIVVNARLVGAPEDRHQRILTAQLATQGDVVRYLLLLLAAIGDDSAQTFANALLTGTSGESAERPIQVPLLESMVRALARSPEALDHVNRLIDDLSSTDEGRALLPDGLAEVWPPIWAARQELAG